MIGIEKRNQRITGRYDHKSWWYWRETHKKDKEKINCDNGNGRQTDRQTDRPTGGRLREIRRETGGTAKAVSNDIDTDKIDGGDKEGSIYSAYRAGSSLFHFLNSNI